MKHERGMMNELRNRRAAAPAVHRSSFVVHRLGFSFAEVMFAVVVLGIGFIMVAAIFPVAIKQTQLNTEETVGVAIARNGVNLVTAFGTMLNPNINPNNDPPTVALMPRTDIFNFNSGARSALALPSSGDFSFRLGKLASFRDRRFSNEPGPSTGNVRFQRDGMWRTVSGNLIQPTDPRYAWVPLYMREMEYKQVGPSAYDKPMPFARVVVFGCTVRNRSLYTSGDVTPYVPASNPNTQQENPDHFTTLEPKPVGVQVKLINGNPDEGYYISFVSVEALSAGFPVNSTNRAIYDGFARDAVGEGSFVVISDDRIVTGGNQITESSGRMNGKILRVGQRRTDLDESTGQFTRYAWTLMPGYDFTPDAGPDGQFGSNRNDDINRLGADDSGVYGNVTIDGVPTTGGNVEFAGSGGTEGCVAYIIGRGFTNPQFTPGNQTTSSDYEGATQDVAVYVTYIPVK